MISNFASLLELFAGFGLTIYCLAGLDIIRFFRSRTIKEQAEIQEEIKKMFEKSTFREGLSVDKKLNFLLTGGDAELIREFTKEDVITFRHDFFTIAQYALYLIMLSGFEGDFKFESTVIAIVFNFSIITLVFCLNRFFSTEVYNRTKPELMRRELWKMLLGFVFSFTVGVMWSPTFPLVFTKALIVLVIILPIVLNLLRFSQKRINRLYEAIREGTFNSMIPGPAPGWKENQ